MATADIFKALGDPVRLKMVQRLADGSHYTVGSLSYGLDLTRQGARKHLQVLADAKLVSLEVQGRQTEVVLDIASLITVKLFIRQLEHSWDQRLQALRKIVENS